MACGCDNEDKLFIPVPSAASWVLHMPFPASKSTVQGFNHSFSPLVTSHSTFGTRPEQTKMSQSSMVPSVLSPPCTLIQLLKYLLLHYKLKLLCGVGLCTSKTLLTSSLACGLYHMTSRKVKMFMSKPLAVKTFGANHKGSFSNNQRQYTWRIGSSRVRFSAS